MRDITTDYLVVGAGAAGLAFVDELIARSDGQILLIDRRHQGGGHWLDAYPFVQLHQPSAFYGVNSLRLGTDAVDTVGSNAGSYHRATGAEILSYFRDVLEDRLLNSGRVTFIPGTDFLGSDDDGCHLLVRGVDHVTVRVQRKLVDARYLESIVPATHSPQFTVEDDVAVPPVNQLPNLLDRTPRYVILGGGKTAMDAVVWLLDNDIDPGRIRWVRPRDSWILDRAGWQPLDLLPETMAGFADDLEAAAEAESLSELAERLEERGRLMRIDRATVPTMYRCAILSAHELTQLRQVDDVVRMGRVRHVGAHQVVMTEGIFRSEPGTVYVDCTAAGTPARPVRPIFEKERITLQQIRTCSPSFNAAFAAYVEAGRDDIEEQNRLCPPMPYPDTPADWARLLLNTLTAAAAWRNQPDVDKWINNSRLNMYHGIHTHLTNPRMQRAMTRYQQHVLTATNNLPRLLTNPRLTA